MAGEACGVLCFGLLALACAGGADGERTDPSQAADSESSAREEPDASRTIEPDARPPELPSLFDDPAEVEMQALSVETFGPAPAAECGLPELSAGGGALVYFGCTPESGPVVRAVPARSLPEPDPEAALAALFEGPTEAERARGFLSSFGPETADVRWRWGRRNGVAWIDFDPEILEVEGLFVVPMDSAQIVSTLGQFEGTERVLILVGGEPLCRATGEC